MFISYQVRELSGVGDPAYCATHAATDCLDLADSKWSQRGKPTMRTGCQRPAYNYFLVPEPDEADAEAAATEATGGDDGEEGAGAGAGTGAGAGAGDATDSALERDAMAAMALEGLYRCPRCADVVLSGARAIQEHKDLHVAQDFAAQRDRISADVARSFRPRNGGGAGAKKRGRSSKCWGAKKKKKGGGKGAPSSTMTSFFSRK